MRLTKLWEENGLLRMDTKNAELTGHKESQPSYCVKSALTGSKGILAGVTVTTDTQPLIPEIIHSKKKINSACRLTKALFLMNFCFAS